MATKEVTRTNWEKFCQRITELSHVSTVTIQFEEPDGSTNVIMDNAPLQRVILDEKSNPCNDIIVVEAGLANEKTVQHLIIEPIHIRLKNGHNGRYNQLHILAENGTTILTLRPGVSPELLEGLDQR